MSGPSDDQIEAMLDHLEKAEGLTRLEAVFRLRSEEIISYEQSQILLRVFFDSRGTGPAAAVFRVDETLDIRGKAVLVGRLEAGMMFVGQSLHVFRYGLSARTITVEQIESFHRLTDEVSVGDVNIMTGDATATFFKAGERLYASPPVAQE